MNKFVNPDAGTTTIIANGQPRSVKAGSTIADLLQELNIAPMRVVTQLDGVIVSRSEFDKAVLQEGCQLEIVTMVGGGEVGGYLVVQNMVLLQITTRSAMAVEQTQKTEKMQPETVKHLSLGGAEAVTRNT